MSDQCVYCTLRGKSVEECRKLECYKLDDWITQSLSTDLEAAQKENAKLNRTIAMISAVIDYCPYCGANIGRTNDGDSRMSEEIKINFVEIDGFRIPLKTDSEYGDVISLPDIETKLIQPLTVRIEGMTFDELKKRLGKPKSRNEKITGLAYGNEIWESFEKAQREIAIFNKILELMEKDSCLFQGPGHPMEIIESFKDRATAIIVEGETK